MPILDTNILLRFLTEDDLQQSARAYALVHELQDGKRSVVLPEAVVAETVFALVNPRTYAVDRETIRRRLGAVLRIPRIRVPEKRILLEALEIFAENRALSFVDALCAAHAKALSDRTVLSFDRDFKNLAGIHWEEP